MEFDDLPAVKRINEDSAVRGNVVGWGWPNSLRELENWFSSSQGGSTHRWMVETHDGQAIGVTGLWDVDWHNRNALTALKLGGVDEVRGRGAGSDAIKLVMAFAFFDVGLERLHSTILENNTASLKAYVEHCGWSNEGTARRHVWRHGTYVDAHHIGVLREEFERLPDSEA
ncbi:MAG: GNAT family protein, partial [Nocardioides sp.]|nr:GNAT family protein [Nocardioides sp.]